MLQLGKGFSGYGEVSFKAQGNCEILSAKIPETVEEAKQYIDIEDVDIMEDQLIGYEEYIKIIEQLKHVKGIKVFKSGQTYQGRDIYTIRILPDLKGYISTNKLINLNPTQIINSRHHANEVSATNAAFMVLKEILTQEKYRDLGNRMNLLITPMENADGAAIHYELQKQHPTWIFHIARYNSLGKEFYRDYYEGIMIKGYYANVYKEILSGGRYDSLTQEFGRRVPAIGFCIDVDGLIKASKK